MQSEASGMLVLYESIPRFTFCSATGKPDVSPIWGETFRNGICMALMDVSYTCDGKIGLT